MSESDIVISVENLSKRYLVGHEGPQERYHSLRDSVVRHGKNILRKTVDMAKGKQIIQGDTVEEFWALKDVSFEVKRGEVLGIIGRNGAGKSTLLKILSRITEPTSGRVTLRGRVASLLEVGTGFHPELSGRENIFLNGAILGMSRAEIKSKFDEIVAFAAVEKFLDTPVKRYSSGMYVRLAFAVAAHLDPEILIIDEVLAVGDAEFQKKCLGKMQEVAKGGRTVLFVSHNLKALEHFCTSGLLMEVGKLEMHNTVRNSVSEYLRRSATQVGVQLGRSLSDELDLVKLQFTPSTASPLEPVEFSFDLQAKVDCQIHDLHLFIYNSFGERVAIIDLRDPSIGGGTRTMVGGEKIAFLGKLARMNIVDGRYRVGFALRTSRHFQAFYDLLDVVIVAAGPCNSLMPYAQEYQGTTLLDYTFNVEVLSGLDQTILVA